MIFSIAVKYQEWWTAKAFEWFYEKAEIPPYSLVRYSFAWSYFRAYFYSQKKLNLQNSSNENIWTDFCVFNSQSMILKVPMETFLQWKIHLCPCSRAEIVRVSSGCVITRVLGSKACAVQVAFHRNTVFCGTSFSCRSFILLSLGCWLPSWSWNDKEKK